MDPLGNLHFVGELIDNRTSILVSFNPATKEFTSELYNYTMISAIKFDSDMNMFMGGHTYGTPLPIVNGFLDKYNYFFWFYIIYNFTNNII